MDMGGKKWTKHEDTTLLKNVAFDHRGFACNVEHLVELLQSRSKRAIYHRINNLRKCGKLADLCLDDPIDPYFKPFTKDEDRIIIGALKMGTTPTEIGEALDRSMHSIQGRIKLLRSRGEDIPRLTKKFADDEIQLLIENVQFDKYGYVSNTDELTSLLKRSKPVIRQKLMQLRKIGLIETLPDKTKSGISCNTRNAFKKQNDLCFIFNKKQPTPVPASVSQTVNN
ncbi:hypothetical protein [Enterococcus sp.]|uniref:hypothetical protein n=1 Tax=Enterococcus sp. TaxID=35783 RepID=UPI0028A8ED59|nr:hypothetical protein [Enterococcus sp.]